MAHENGVAETTKITKSDVWQVPIELVDIDETQNPREDYGDLIELADTITEHGILTPTRGYKTGDRFFVVQGNRRVQAGRIAAQNGAKVIVPIVSIGKDKSRKNYLTETAIGNRFKEMTPLELAKLVAEYKEVTELKNAEVGKKLGFTEAYVGRLLKLHAAPEEFREVIKKGLLSGTAAMKIIRDGRVDEIVEQYKTNGEVNVAGLNGEAIVTDKVKERKQNDEETDKVNSWREFGKFAVHALPKKMSTEKTWSTREVFNFLIKIQNNEIDRPDYDKKFKQDA